MELVAGDRWIFSVLEPDETLRSMVSGVFSFPAPGTTTFPYVIFQDVSSQDLRGVGPIRIGLSGEWLVRAVGESNTYGGTLETIADRVDTLLQAASGSQVWSCVRLRPFRLIETSSGRQIRHLGGFYRLWVHARGS